MNLDREQMLALANKHGLLDVYEMGGAVPSENVIACFRELLATRPQLPPLDDTMRDILGRPNFTCIGLANGLRVRGHAIKTRAEDEQAAVIYFLLQLYLQHGAAWEEAAAKYWNETAPKAAQEAKP